jgi:hypothetical protein
MSLASYGPIHYLHLMRTHALALQPNIIIIGLSLGTDFREAYNMVRHNERWSGYGDLGPAVEGPAVIPPAPPPKFLGGLREWLSNNSLLYAVATRHPAFDFVRKREAANRNEDDPGTVFTYKDDRHDTMFDLSARIRFLDMDDPRIMTGLEVTKRALLDMQREADSKGIRLIVAVFPTKLRVYAKLLEDANHLDENPKLAEALQQESVARDAISNFLRAHKFEIIDLLPSLEAEALKRDIYPATDGHPNKDGYRLIAEVINRHLNEIR